MKSPSTKEVVEGPKYVQPAAPNPMQSIRADPKHVPHPVHPPAPAKPAQVSVKSKIGPLQKYTYAIFR